MHPGKEGTTTPGGQSLGEDKAGARQDQETCALQGGGLLSTHKPQSLCSQMCLEKPELRDAGGTGERGSVCMLLLWSQTARPRSNPSSTPSWLGELGPSLLGFSPFIYTNLRWLG